MPFINIWKEKMRIENDGFLLQAVISLFLQSLEVWLIKTKLFPSTNDNPLKN